MCICFNEQHGGAAVLVVTLVCTLDMHVIDEKQEILGEIR